MTTDTLARPTAAPGVTPARVAHSEWIKLRTLRSTYYTLLAGTLALVGFGPLFSAVTAQRWPHASAAWRAQVDPTALSLVGFYLAQLAVGVLGVLVVTGEYSTGMIRATLAAVPRRLPVLWAKAAVYAVVVWVLTTVGALVAFLAGQALLAPTGIGASLGDPGEVRAVLGTGVYLTVVGLLGLGIGALLRNTAGGTTAVFGLLLVVPEIVRFLPPSWSGRIGPYLPGNAGHAFVLLHHGPDSLAPWTGLAVFCLYAAVTLAGAAVALMRRDA